MDHPNPYVSCPYNVAHQVPLLRLQRHLVKCRKNHQRLEMTSCPFNATHIFPEPEYPHHLQYCPDRKLIEASKYNGIIIEDHGHLGNPPFHMDLPTENWDEVDDDELVLEHMSTTANEIEDESLHTKPVGRCYQSRDQDEQLALKPLRLPRQPPNVAQKEQKQPVNGEEVLLQRDWMGMGRGSVQRIIAASKGHSFDS